MVSAEGPGQDPGGQRAAVLERELEEARRGLEEARQAAARLAAIVEWSDDAMFSITPDAIIQTWNPGAQRLLGYTAAEITGRHASTFLPPGLAQHLPNFLERTAAGELSASHNVRCVRKDGSVIDVAFTCAAVRDADGTVTGFSVVLRDDTPRLAAEAAVAAARAEREVVAERDRMARDLHDRVIQRIFAAGMALQTVARLTRNPQVTTRIETVVHDLDMAIDELRETIFTLRRGQREGTGLRFSILAVVGETAPALGFSPEVTLQGPVDKVSGEDAEQVLAVCREALSNIARHAAASAATVILSVDDDLLLSVCDNGRGMGTPVKFGGLANMRQRAEIRGGTFRAGGQPGGGTRIEWRVPL